MGEKIYKKEIENIVVLTGLNFEESLEAHSILGFKQIETYCYCKGSKWFRDTFHTGKNLIIKLDLTNNLKSIINYRFKNISKNNSDTVRLNTIKNVSLEINRCGQRCREMLREYSKDFIEWFDLNFNYEDKLLTPIKILYYYGGSIHTINAIRRSCNKFTVKDFINSKDNELLKLRDLGAKGLEQTKIALLEYKDLNNLS